MCVIFPADFKCYSSFFSLAVSCAYLKASDMKSWMLAYQRDFVIVLIVPSVFINGIAGVYLQW